MTEKLPFTHSDGRVFTPAGEAPHTTKDGRQILLNVWVAPCTKPNCRALVTVKTATPTPAEWRAFTPAQYCRPHRDAARKRASAEGLRKWLDSPKGRAERAGRTGVVEDAVIDAVAELSLVSDGVSVTDLLDAVEQGMPHPAEGKRDTRRYRARRALDMLIVKDRMFVRDNRIFLGARPPLRHERGLDLV